MIFKHPFKGVKQGDIYHTDFVPGDVCPPELLDAAIACEVVEAPTEKATKRKAKAE